MGITRQYGVTAIQDLARQAGRAQAAREAEQMEFAAEQAKLDRQFKKDMQLMNYQFEIEAQTRSKAWELEKMETSSRLDFEYSEKKRMTMQAELDNKLEALRKAVGDGVIDEDESNSAAQKAKLEAALSAEAAGLHNLARSLYDQVLPKPTEMERLMELTREQKAEAVPQQSEVEVTPEISKAHREALQGEVVPISDVAPVDMIVNEQGEFALVHPDGRKVWATPAEVPVLQAQGYQAVKKSPEKDYWRAFFPHWKPKFEADPAGMAMPGWGQSYPIATPLSREEQIRQATQKAVSGTKPYGQRFKPEVTW